MTDSNRPALENVNQLKDRLIAAVDRSAPEITAVAADIFAHPELGRQEAHASELLTQHLTAAGFSVQQPAAGMPTAFIAGLDGAAPGATIALLAEYDALPELGHACGHNLIAAASLGAALALAEVMPELNGRLLCIGTPDEEGPGGKLDHVRAGTFNGVDAALMFHPSDRTLVDTHGLALQQFELVWAGKPAHCAAAPDQGINALSGAIQTFVAIDAFRQHLRPDARINGIITDGGKRPNIFPERAAASFTLRAGTSEYLDEVIAGFTACVQGAAAATRTKVTILPGERFDDLRNTPALVELFTANLNRLGEPIDVGEPGLGSTDMGNVTHVIPGLHPYIKTGPAGAACHTHGFLAYAGGSEGQRAVLVAAKALALTALDLFVSPETVARVRASFNLALSK